MLERELAVLRLLVNNDAAYRISAEGETPMLREHLKAR
jgi:hypothetical protein